MVFEQLRGHASFVTRTIHATPLPPSPCIRPVQDSCIYLEQVSVVAKSPLPLMQATTLYASKEDGS
jgi:hypothetical protein